jgi:sigma-E factor negative regulatory protein RseA
MTQQFDEQLSAFVDGEVDDAAGRQVINKLTQDAEFKQRWQNYHLIGDTLRDPLAGSASVPNNFADSVMQALQSEPTILAPKTANKHHLSPITKRIAGAAIAASVATVAVLGVQNLYQSPEPTQLATMPANDAFVRMPQINPAFASASNSAGSVVPQSNGLMQAAGPRSRTDLPNSEVSERIQNHLHRYLVDHTQNLDNSRVQGISPYARIVVSPNPRQD